MDKVKVIVAFKDNKVLLSADIEVEVTKENRESIVEEFKKLVYQKKKKNPDKIWITEKETKKKTKKSSVRKKYKTKTGTRSYIREPIKLRMGFVEGDKVVRLVDKERPYKIKTIESVEYTKPNSTEVLNFTDGDFDISINYRKLVDNQIQKHENDK